MTLHERVRKLEELVEKLLGQTQYLLHQVGEEDEIESLPTPTRDRWVIQLMPKNKKRKPLYFTLEEDTPDWWVEDIDDARVWTSLHHAKEALSEMDCELPPNYRAPRLMRLESEGE
jgi:hypothetical protein